MAVHGDQALRGPSEGDTGSEKTSLFHADSTQLQPFSPDEAGSCRASQFLLQYVHCTGGQSATSLQRAVRGLPQEHPSLQSSLCRGVRPQAGPDPPLPLALTDPPLRLSPAGFRGARLTLGLHMRTCAILP